ncbi:OLC1v1005421C1 [Oldenlandia corymbosa var. corymbosa]|uniref:OLC1v1005421C1 n=1 Tax=Oldenlandia corymbosa var. corymbosa TaxID=529605 RepID=A0AAV1DET2_OLDCO|nr:OLC1v1005421C1 [Oldenlandia corymbosa var. corymbosa]
MSSSVGTKHVQTKGRQSLFNLLCTSWKTVLICGALVSYSCYTFYSSDHPKRPTNSIPDLTSKEILHQPNSSTNDDYQDLSPTNINHLRFGIVGSEVTWRGRKGFVEAWWRPNFTQGYLYLDQSPTGDLLPWPSSFPPFRVLDDQTELINEIKPAVPTLARVLHAIYEILKEEEGKTETESFRWLVMGDDDTVFFVDNLVDVLSEFNHTKYWYIGGVSESILTNFLLSFNMAFGGAGFVLSYPLAKAFAQNFESCLRRYSQLETGDFIEMSCVADIGVNLSPHKGLHQIDLHGDISGLLSSHPMTPLVSLHNFDAVEPIFPGMDRIQSINHLMKAGNIAGGQQSRLMQQTICHHRRHNWTISVSWGYSVHIYEKIMPRSLLQLPLQTFGPWVSNPDPPFYRFNTRLPSREPCDAPHVFFFESIEKPPSDDEDFVVLSSYYRSSPRDLPPCVDGEHSADYVTHIHVHSPATKPIEKDRCECCDIESTKGMKNAIVKFRECMPGEIIA